MPFIYVNNCVRGNVEGLDEKKKKKTFESRRLLFARPFRALSKHKVHCYCHGESSHDVNRLNRSPLFLNGFAIQPELLDSAQQL